MENNYLNKIKTSNPITKGFFGITIVFTLFFLGSIQLVKAQDIGVSALVNPTSPECSAANQTVTVTIKNYDVSIIDFTNNNVTVTVNISGASTQLYTTALTTGILAAGATQDVIVTTTADLSASGTQVFDAHTSVAGDVNPANDAMPPVNITVNPNYYDYTYTLPVTINNNGIALNNYQVKIIVNTATIISGAKMQSSCNDIRIKDSDGTTPLNYWVESGCNTANTVIWVRVPSILANSSKTIYLHYGNSQIPSASNIDMTMDTGLNVFYYQGTNFDTFLGNCVELAAPNYNWGSGNVSLSNCPNNLADNVSIRWEGWVKNKGDGNHTFYYTTDDGSRLYVDNNLILNNWNDQAPAEYSGSYSFSNPVSIKYEYYEHSAGAVSRLGWKPADGSGKVYPIPSDNVRHNQIVTDVPSAILGAEITSSLTDASLMMDTPISICAGDSVLIYGTYQHTNGQFYNNLITASGCDSIRSKILNIFPLPAISITANRTTAFSGVDIIFTASIANAGSTPAYQWIKNGINVGTNNSTYSSNTLSSTDTIRCKVTSSSGCVASVLSNKIASSILPAGSYPIFAMQSGGYTNNKLYVLDSTDFNVLYTIPLHGSLGEVIIGNTGLTTSNLGVIYASLQLQGQGNSRFLATINPNDSVATIINKMSDKYAGIAWAGDSLFGLTGNGANRPSTLYKLNPLNADTTSIISFALQYGQTLAYCSDNHRLYQFGTNGSQHQQITKINPNYPYDTTTVIPSGYNRGEDLSAIYIGGGKFMIQTWSEFAVVDTNGIAALSSFDYNNYYKGMTFPKYLISRTGAAAICANDSSLLTATTQGSAYQWYNGTTAISGANNANYYAKTTGRYRCEITIGGVPHMSSTSDSVTVNSLPVVAITGANGFCTGLSIILAGTIGGTSHWYKNGVLIAGANSSSYSVNTPGVYNMTKTNTNGCTDSAGVGKTVAKFAKPTTHITASSLSICAGTPDTLIAATTGGIAPYSYVWSPAGVQSLTRDTTVITPANAQAGPNNKWKVIAADHNGCASLQDTVKVTVFRTDTTTITPVAICNGDSYSFYSSNISTAGIHYHHLINANGCDSVIAVHLTVNNPTTSDTTVVACNAYTWNSITYNSTPNTDPTIILTNSAGCDSTVTLHLTINNSTTGNTTVVACDSYTWNSVIYITTPNVAPTKTLINAVGCDSIVTLYLTINHSTTGDATVAACDSYSWNSVIYNSTPSTNPTMILMNSTGCDSTVTLHLTINTSPVITTQSGNFTTCGDASILAYINSAGNNSYQWYYNYTPNPGNPYMIDGTKTEIHFDTDSMTIQSVVGGQYDNYFVYCTITDNAAGCSIKSANDSIRVSTVDLTTSTSNDTIWANQANATSYQWIDCAANIAINGETNQNYVAAISGDYAVVVTKGVCSDTSACVNVIETGIKSKMSTVASNISIYPNPSAGMFTVNAKNIKSVKVFNAIGEVVYQASTNDVKINIDISAEALGIYMLQVVTSNGTTQYRIVKQ